MGGIFMAIIIQEFIIYEKITIDAIEGQIVIFPSFIIHRSPRIIEDVRKTIISFNIDFLLIQSSLLEKFSK